MSLCSHVELSDVPASCSGLPSTRIIKEAQPHLAQNDGGGHSVNPLFLQSPLTRLQSTSPRGAEQGQRGRLCSQWHVNSVAEG